MYIFISYSVYLCVAGRARDRAAIYGAAVWVPSHLLSQYTTTKAKLANIK